MNRLWVLSHQKHRPDTSGKSSGSFRVVIEAHSQSLKILKQLSGIKEYEKSVTENHVVKKRVPLISMGAQIYIWYGLRLGLN